MSDLAAGLRYVGRGQKWVARNGRWYGFGLLPALITLVIYAVALTALIFWADDLATWATPFADEWGDTWRRVLRITFAVLLIALGLLLAVLTFTAVTLLIGDPFYEALSERVEETEGGCPEGPDLGLWRGLWLSLTDSIHVLLRALAWAIPLFVLGFVPVVGQTVVPVVGLAVSGFFLTVELTSVAMQRRGIPVRRRLGLLRERKGLALGFGVPVVLGFLVPLGAIFLMPGAVAGATLLVRGLLGEEEPEPEGAAKGEVAGFAGGEPHGAGGAAPGFAGGAPSGGGQPGQGAPGWPTGGR